MHSRIIFGFYVAVALLASVVKVKGRERKPFRAGLFAPSNPEDPQEGDWVKPDAGHAKRLSAKHSTCIGPDVCFFYTKIESKEHVITVPPRFKGHVTTSPSLEPTHFQRRAPTSNSSPQDQHSQGRNTDLDYYEDLGLHTQFSKSLYNPDLEFVKNIEQLRKWSQDNLKRDFDDDKSFSLAALHYFGSEGLFIETFDESKALETSETLDVLKAGPDDPRYVACYFRRVRQKGCRDRHFRRKMRKQHRAQQTQSSAGDESATGGDSSNPNASSNPSGFVPHDQDREHSPSAVAAAKILQGMRD
ncbi:hypothetical protein F5878DRAFT_203659 [Lentinula raphanica]|uniref:Uncharacterized protein n=1 Tax=Lentinula raphanica TaxID=153919 RepID=A0AA38P7F4_9AGAR|nr:hypothetical protein F5880DRAFT_468330 [Lentinula raphanica]KAJ3837680.1 hypothetical protein F5878DRAFT_203659 [Lentinula raphanica]